MNVETAPRLERVTTGVEALDGVLDGGIPRGAVVFVSGLPGAGKTILSEQALFANARNGVRSLYLTTLSEPPLKMLRFGSTLSFFDPALLEEEVRFADLGSALLDGGPQGMLARVDELIREQRPEFIVIDSFKVLREYFSELREFRAFASQLLVSLATWEITTLLVGEYTLEDIEEEPEFAIADGIIHLSGSNERMRQKRFLNVIKMRGTPAFLGEHYFEITPDGIVLYPRMLAAVTGEYGVGDDRLGSVVPGMNEMLGGGLLLGSVTIISGGAGAGKTLTALGFTLQAVRDGLQVLLVSFEESPHQIERNGAMFGWEIRQAVDEGKLDIMHVSPSELDLDRHAVLIQRRAMETGAKLVIIDSISAFEAAISSASKLHEYLWGIADHFRRDGVALIVTTERYSFFETGNDAERYVSYVADTILLLRLAEVDSDLRRLINVLKSRGTYHDSRIHELRMSRTGIAVEPAS